MAVTTLQGPTLAEAKQAVYEALGESAIIIGMTVLEDGSVEVKAIAKDPAPVSSVRDNVPLPANGPLSASIPLPASVPLRSSPAQPRSPAPAQDPARDEGPATTGDNAPLSHLGTLAARTSKNQETGNTPASGRSDRARRAGGTGLHKSIEKKSSEEALRDLRGHLAGKLMGTDANETPFHLFLRDKLSLHGISPGLIKELAAAADTGAAPITGTDTGYRSALSQALQKVLSFSTPPLAKNTPLMLVGQTGAGKTSCAAKIAAYAAQTGQKVAFFTADTSRAGAMDQMATYADALNTQFWDVEDPSKITEVLDHERPEGILVLDTPGISPFAAEDLAAIRAFRESLKAEPLLVLPASGDAREHLDWANAFRGLGVNRCIITKFDTSRRIGAAVDAAYQSGLALSYFSETPFIADGIIEANADYLASRLLMEAPARLAGKTM